MKRLLLIALLLTAWATLLAAADKIIDRKRFVFRDHSDAPYGVTYEKFSATPFTGIAQGWTDWHGSKGDRGKVYLRKTTLMGLVMYQTYGSAATGSFVRRDSGKTA